MDRGDRSQATHPLTAKQWVAPSIYFRKASFPMPETKLNGSVELLAQAMRQVFSEAVEEGDETSTDADSRDTEDAQMSPPGARRQD